MSINSVKEDEEQKDSVKIKVIMRLFGYMLKYKKQIAFVLVCMFIALGISIVNPLLLQRAIDVDIVNGNWKGLVIIVAVSLVLSIIYMVSARMWMKTMAHVSNDVLLTIRDELYTHIQTLSFSFFDSRPTGKILSRVIGDVNSLKDVIQSTVTQLLPDFLTVIVVLVMMIIVNPYLTLSAVAALPVIFAGMYITEILAHKRWQVFRKKSSNISAFVHEDLSGIGIVQSFTAEKESEKEFDGLVKEHQQSFIKAVALADVFSPTIEISWGIGTFLLYFIGIRKLGTDAVGVGTYTAFAIYLSMFWGPIRNLASYYNKLVTNISAAERVFDIMDTPADVTDSEDAIELGDIKGHVQFEHVGFAYPDEPDVKVLDDVNFDIRPGETIALVGPTGAGKTTIVSLISRFYNATEGRVLVDGMDIKDVTLASLRHRMGVMTQDNFLFSGTIRENIKYGRRDATDEEMVAAAKAVHAHQFIMQLEKGYDTEISERGARLSIGQRQLLAIARAAVADPPVLILDEATSSIDTRTERLVQKGMDALMSGRTSFVIAHRLSTVRNADCIMVMEQGRIIERGTHDQLMEEKGRYYQLYTGKSISA